jgi:uncharacterized protein YqjF (DUF2071 family)
VRPFLTAQWRWLVIVDFEVDPAMLEPLVPRGTVLDFRHGRSLVSVVGFRFLDTRVLGVAVPAHRDFDEVNLRFYVRREMPDGSVRRGVTFVRELVPRLGVALLARATYNEPYLTLPMRSVAPSGPTDKPGRLHYAWQTPRGWSRLTATATGDPTPISPESPAGFVAERHWGYTRQRDGGTIEYHVEHRRWWSWRVEDAALEADTAVYGPEWAPVLRRDPVSALIADGSAVRVSRPSRLTANG